MERDVDVRGAVEHLGPDGGLVGRLGLAVPTDKRHDDDEGRKLASKPI